MISINRNELGNFTRIGSGMFATVYTDYTYTYKIYHRMCVDYNRDLQCKNPSLRYRPLKINRLMQLDKKIENTDLIKDIINVDGKFGGVLLPYYGGETLSHLDDISFEQKLKICREILKNSKELIDNYIYPNDIALRNIIYSDGNVRIIDLDDVLTKVCLFYNPFYYNKSITGVDSTIKTFLGELDGVYNRLCLDNRIKEYLTSKCEYLEIKTSFEKIEEYLDAKAEYSNYFLIHDDSDINMAKSFQDNGYKIIFIRDNKEALRDDRILLKMFDDLRLKGITLYDTIEACKIDKYLQNSAVENALESHKKLLIKKL